MILKLIRLTLIVNVNIACKKLYAEDLNLANALSDISGKHFVNISTALYLIDTNKNFPDENNFLITEVFKRIGSDIAVQIEDIDHAKVLKRRKRFCVIIFAENKKVLQNSISKITPDKFHFNGYYLIVLRNPENHQEIFELFWNKFIYNVNIIAEDSGFGSIKLATFLPFQDERCNCTTPVKINDFNASNKSWNDENFYPKKFKDLQNCTIKVGTYIKSPYVIAVNNSEKLIGPDAEYFAELARSINFNIDFKMYPFGAGSVMLNESGVASSTGLFNKVIEGHVEIIICFLSLQINRTQAMTASMPYNSDQIILVIPPASSLHPFLKLFHPFNIQVWITFFVLTLSIFALVSITKIMSTRVNHFIFGSNVRNPFLNIFGGFIGMTQHKLPMRNFARFILMMFLILTLIVRSLYLASLFNILKTEVKSKELKTIRELMEQKFDFYTYETLAERSEGLRFESR